MTCSPNVVRSRWATFASGTPISVCSSTTSATTAGTELHAGRAQRVGGLQHVAALHPPLTLRAVADLDVEAPHDRAHHGQLFLILRRHAGHFDRAAAVRTRRRNRRRVGFVDPRRARAAAVAAIRRTGPPSGVPPATLRPVLGKRRSLPATRPACLVQLSFQALDLLLQAVNLPLQAVVLALQPLGVALAPRHLPLEPFDFGVQVFNPILSRFPVRGCHANVMPQSRNLYNCQNVDGPVPSTLTEDGEDWRRGRDSGGFAGVLLRQHTRRAAVARASGNDV